MYDVKTSPRRTERDRCEKRKYKRTRKKQLSGQGEPIKYESKGGGIERWY